MRLRLKVVPKASRSRISGWLGDRLKVQVTAAPERGRANEEVLGLLAAALQVPVSSLGLASGSASPLKEVETGLSETELLRRLPPRPT